MAAAESSNSPLRIEGLLVHGSGLAVDCILHGYVAEPAVRSLLWRQQRPARC